MRLYYICMFLEMFISFFFNDTATTDIYTSCHTRSLHDALPFFGLHAAGALRGLVDAAADDELTAELLHGAANGGADHRLAEPAHHAVQGAGEEIGRAHV